ncbi:hypothetical protein K443DRAFT_548088 [Laccaria amethystina LaAM-08-1]|uniref:Uncharacterized protein n=1 Tax=Laccaria amethystina LaAM-08-1 TaxID=1095629 RepID=A0A0C9WSI2_9AGAR|nr:hypothetical protein K443DRAFT_548088 [Laccaria amethystina LaAM-08-1]
MRQNAYENRLHHRRKEGHIDLEARLSQGVCTKKSPYTGLFYFDKDSWTPPPSPSLPKKEINHVFTNQIQLSTRYADACV